MLNAFYQLSRLIARFRYPVSLPEDVTETLGIEVSNFLSFDDLLAKISSAKCNPLSLSKYMPRKEAESAFRHATCIEQFSEKTLASYFFPEGWVEFVLKFDQQSRLRRIYFLHKSIEEEQGIEISLCSSYIGKKYISKESSQLGTIKHLGNVKLCDSVRTASSVKL